MLVSIGRLRMAQAAIMIIGLLTVGCTVSTNRQNTAALPREQQSLMRTTCPNDDIVSGNCVEFLHQQPREFWEKYQQEAPALREGFLSCTGQRDTFGDWVRGKRDELRQKDRQVNMVSGYLPHVVVAESDLIVHQMASAFITTEYHQIINRGARPDLCQERIAFWKAQILGVTEKFPPLRESQRHNGDGWSRPQ